MLDNMNFLCPHLIWWQGVIHTHFTDIYIMRLCLFGCMRYFVISLRSPVKVCPYDVFLYVFVRRSHCRFHIHTLTHFVFLRIYQYSTFIFEFIFQFNNFHQLKIVILPKIDSLWNCVSTKFTTSVWMRLKVDQLFLGARTTNNLTSVAWM